MKLAKRGKHQERVGLSTQQVRRKSAVRTRKDPVTAGRYQCACLLTCLLAAGGGDSISRYQHPRSMPTAMALKKKKKGKSPKKGKVTPVVSGTDPEWLWRIKGSPDVLATIKDAPDQVRSDQDLMLAAVAKDRTGVAAQFASEALRADRSFMLAAIHENGKAFDYATPELVDTLMAGGFLGDLKESWLRTKIVAASSPRGGGGGGGGGGGSGCEGLLDAIRDTAPAAVRGDRDVMLAAIAKEGEVVQYASEALRSEKGFMLAAIEAKDDASVVQYASEALRADRSFMLAAIAKDWEAVRYASGALRSDEAVMVAAIAKDVRAMKFASAALLAEKDFMLAAASKNARAVQYAPEALRADGAFMLAAIDANHLVVDQVPSSLRESRSFMPVALLRARIATDHFSVVPHMLRQASVAARDNRVVMMAAAAKNGMAARYASKALRGDRQFMLTAAASNEESLVYATASLLDSLVDEGNLQAMKAKPDQPLLGVKEIWEEFKASPTTITAAQLAQLKAARQALADQHFALPKEEQEAMQFQQVYPGTDKEYYASLNAALADGSTALLRADFLERLAAEGRPLGHRAELPPEAFYEGPIWGEVYNVETRARDGVIIVALSYMWATLDHPDPKGEQLRDVARFLRWLQKADGDHKGKLVAVMWDWASLYQDKPFANQQPKPWRTDEQTKLSTAGLRNANLWYCHPLTITLMNRKTPAGRSNEYNVSGWPVSEPVKVHESERERRQLLAVFSLFLSRFFSMLTNSNGRDGNSIPKKYATDLRAGRELFCKGWVSCDRPRNPARSLGDGKPREQLLQCCFNVQQACPGRPAARAGRDERQARGEHSHQRLRQELTQGEVRGNVLLEYGQGEDHSASGHGLGRQGGVGRIHL